MYIFTKSIWRRKEDKREHHIILQDQAQAQASGKIISSLSLSIERTLDMIQQAHPQNPQHASNFAYAVSFVPCSLSLQTHLWRKQIISCSCTSMRAGNMQFLILALPFAPDQTPTPEYANC